MVIYSNVSTITKEKAESGKQAAHSAPTLVWSMVFQNNYVLLDITGENIGGAIFRVDRNTNFDKIFLKYAAIAGIQKERLLFIYKGKQILPHQVVRELGEEDCFYVIVKKKDKKDPSDKVKKYSCLRI